MEDIKIKGIKKIVSESKRLSNSPYNTNYFEVFYDKEEKELWSEEHTNTNSQLLLGENSDSIKICNVCKPITMKELKEICIEALKKM